jgi:hypothetical protein
MKIGSFAVALASLLAGVARGQTGVGPNGVTGPWAAVNDSFLCFYDANGDRNVTVVSH